ncbi:MAG: efflux RND transporter periplasmic adaptor subunit, partial [Myxococcota bacterium]|nr:efflux RND transporter periplasmic adaptor subunit [Myxococcota bacterium]
MYPSRFMRFCRSLGLGLLSCLLFASACSTSESEEEPDASAGDDDDSAVDHSVTSVRVVPVVRGTISETIKSSATVDARKRADIHVEVQGTIQALRVEEGDRVRAKQVLAVIKNPQLKGELGRSEANFARAEEDFSGVAGLYEQGYVARREYEEAQLALSNARATVEQARASYASRLIRSPIAGTVSLRDLRYGEAVSTGKLAFQVVDLRDLLVEVSLPEKDLGKLRVGQTVE